MLLYVITAGLNGNNSGSKDYQQDSLHGFALDDILRRFSLPYNKNAIEDSNSIIFYKYGSFDTTFLLHIKRRKNLAHLVYYYLSPAKHRGLNDLKYRRNDLLSFNGISFTLDSIKWDNIKHRANELINQGDTMRPPAACADCPFFYLTTNNKFVNSDISQNQQLENYYKLIKDSILYVEMRKIE